MKKAAVLVLALLFSAGQGHGGSAPAGRCTAPQHSPVSISDHAAPTDGKKYVQVYHPAGVRPDGVFIDHLLKSDTRQSGKVHGLQTAASPEVRIESLPVVKDAFEEVNAIFDQRGWGDGLPLVPPTPERVSAMLRGADLSPDFLVAALDPMGGQATIEKIAINAVMAGCRPEYMPVLITAVEAVADPGFGLRSIATTTNPDTPMLIVSGQIARQLNINYGTNALGRGWRANATISRALHLIIQNIGGSRPGITDMSCFGQPGEFSMMLAENPEANPWEPIHMTLGHPKAANVVTVVAAEGAHSIMGIGQTSQGFLNLVCNHLSGLERAYRSLVLLIIAQDTAGMLARDGWTRDRIQKFIHAHARIPHYSYKQRFIDTGRTGGVPDWVFQIKDPDAMIPVPLIDQLLILVSGGPGEKSLIIPAWSSSKAVSKKIRLSRNWEQLLSQNEESWEVLNEGKRKDPP